MRRAIRLGIPAAVVVLLLVAAARDGFFRDEFYYLACAKRLAWGYVDHPPFCVALLWLVTRLFGDSLLVLRATAALAAAAAVWTTGAIARRLGAGLFGESLAMVGLAVAPVFLAIGSFYSMNILEVLFWAVAARLLIEVVERPGPARWAWLGVVLGIGLLNKISVLWLGAGIGAGLLLTPARRLLLTPGPWIAAAIAGALFAPHLVWQALHGWPTVEFIRNASAQKMQPNPPLAFALDQVNNMHPFTLPIWGAGLAAMLLAPRLRAARILGIAFVTVAAILMLNGTSRSSYLLPAFPMLFAAGGAWWDARVRRPALRAAALAVLVAGGLVTAPLAVPLLSTSAYIRYSRAFGLAPQTEEKQELGRLPQFFADRQGWPDFVYSVGRAWERLSIHDRLNAAVIVGNYGEAGAIERLARGIPVLSGHNSYWLWGPGPYANASTFVVVSRTRDRLDDFFAEVEQVGTTECGDCMPYENGQRIFICRDPRRPLGEVWGELKHYE